MRIETTIFKNLFYNEDFMRKVFPFLKPEYFYSKKDSIIFDEIKTFIDKYNQTPTIEVVKLGLKDRRNVSDDDIEEVEKELQEIYDDKENTSKQDWLIDKTEKFCQEKAVYNAVSSSISILDGKDKQHDKGIIPKLLQDALAVTFDSSVGHDYLENVDERYDFYHRKEQKLAFDIDLLNKITKGGIAPKTLTIVLAGTGVGKSLFMCHCAAANLVLGKNVLYITMEMAEERIAQRIDANLLNVTVDDLMELPKEIYEKKVQKIKDKTVGRLIVKEYPTASASAHNFRALINELNLKKNFIPDIIYIDYLNICASARIKPGASVNSYTYVKAIAEELRGLGVEFNVPIVSATQTTRGGFTNSDPGLEDTSESFGLPATADLMFALISSEELEKLNQIMVKQLKNRYSDPNYNKRFVVGIDRAKMKLYDVEEKAQSEIVKEIDTEMPEINKSNKTNKFQEFKV